MFGIVLLGCLVLRKSIGSVEKNKFQRLGQWLIVHVCKFQGLPPKRRGRLDLCAVEMKKFAFALCW